jgi:hypothetical protein
MTLHAKIREILNQLDAYSGDDCDQATAKLLSAFKECLPNYDKYKTIGFTDFEYEVGYNQCLKDILKMIDEGE